MLYSSAKIRHGRAFVFIGLAIGLLASCSSSRHHEVLSAPNFELKDLSGNAVRLETYLGHPVLLDFWATWCGPCRMSIPMVQNFYIHHKDEGMIVLGLNIDDDPSGVYSFVKQFKMTYPVLLAANSSVPGDYEVEGIPHFVFIDPQGHVERVYQGFSPDMVGAWEEDLKAALKKIP
jgi:thiol-disulfide isomerase/thioredoxin